MRIVHVASFLAVVLGAGCADQVKSTTQALGGPDACITESAGRHLTCTANDVKIAQATAIEIVGGGPLQCVEGSTVSFTATFLIDLNTTARLDTRYFFGTDADPNGDGALSGTCASSVITSSNGSSYVDLDGDACGDVNADQSIQVTLTDIPCVDNDGDGSLDLPTCTSWKQPGSDTVCNTAEDTAPGSPSKCSCDAGFDVPITVVPPSGQLVKAHVEHLSSTERYSLAFSNTSVTQTLTLESLNDSHFGNLLAAHDDVLATTCAGGAVTAPGASFACTFDARIVGGSETDQITATFSDGTATHLVVLSNTLTVTVGASSSSSP